VLFYGISAKRYALFTMAGDHIDVLGIHDDSNREANDDVDLFIVENKEHGLGVYLNPVDPSRDDSKGQRGWVTEVWTYLIRRDMGPDVQEPGWFSRPAMVKLPISTWDVYKAFSVWNEGKLYKDQIKPYGFAMTAKALDFQEGGAEPPGNGRPFRLVAPLTSARHCGPTWSSGISTNPRAGPTGSRCRANPTTPIASGCPRTVP